MTKNIFIAITEPYSGKSIVALGLVDMLLNKAQKVGYFKPVINDDPLNKRDTHIETIVNYFNLNLNFEDTYVFTRQDVMKLIEQGNQGEIIDAIIENYKKLEEIYDFIIIEGSDFLGEGVVFEFDANVTIAKNLGAPVVVVVSGEGKTTAQAINSSLTIVRNFKARDVQIMAVVVNKVKLEQIEDVKELLRNQLSGDIQLAVIPEDLGLKSPSMKEIMDILGGKLLFGEKFISNQAHHFIFGAMQVPNFLTYLKDNVLIVTPGDRADIIISSLQANISVNFPKVAGIVLTGGLEPGESVIRLIDGLQDVVPIISVNPGSFSTATQIGAIQSRITMDNTRKIRMAIDTFKKYVDVQSLDEKIITFKPEGITPHMFQYQL